MTRIMKPKNGRQAMWKRCVVCGGVVAMSWLFASVVWAETVEEVYGNKKKGIKGRYLVVSDGVDLATYRGAIVILEPLEIRADKDRPVDDESIKVNAENAIRERLDQLKEIGFFQRIVTSAPLDMPADARVVRMEPRLSIQYGSQAMRAFVGFGAGKSATHLRIDFIDARTGDLLGYFNGYGTGSGYWSFSGGSAQRMAADDLQESMSVFHEGLQKAIGGVPGSTGKN
jgi:hypothetical protein